MYLFVILLLFFFAPTDIDQFVFASNRDGNSNLYLLNSDGSNLKQLTFGKNEKWSPRVINKDEVSFLEQTPQGIIRNKLNLQTGSVKRLFQPNECTLDDKNAQISPNGRMLLYQCGKDIFVSNLRMRNSANLTKSTGENNFKPTWFPNSKEIAFTSNRGGNQEIYRIGVDGSGLTNLTNNPSNDEAPAISPDGKRMLFSSSRDGNRNREIYLMDLTAGGTKNITNTPDWELIATWGSDSDTVFFGSNRTKNWDIYRLDLRSGKTKNITKNPSFDGDPQLLPR